jgi:nucleotide-binding universal stress UspA family protein
MSTQPASQWRRIVIGLDGSDGARRALDVAVRLARPLGSEVIAVGAVEPPTAFYATDLASPAPTAPPPEPDMDQAQADLERDCAPLREAGIGYRAVTRLAHPAAALIEVANEEHADLLVVGRRGLGSVTELLLGSVSHELSHKSPVPVLIVGPPPR